MAGKRTLVIDFIVDDKDARAALGRVDNAAATTGKAFGKAATAIKVALGAVAARAVIGFAEDSIEAASNLEEAINKVDVIFGNSSQAIKTWAESSASSMGISNAAALEAAGSYGAFFDALGVAKPQATEMSMQLVQLAADMASFNNQDPTEMLAKLQSGLAGEVEPLRKFGVDLSAATVEAKALEMGLASVASELTQSDKVLARYAILLGQTETAQGDFARTSEGAANTQRILTAELENVKAKIGTELLPVYTQLLSALSEIAPVIADSVIPALTNATEGMGAFFNMIEAVFGAVGKLIGQIEQLAAKLGIVGDIKGFLGDFGKGVADVFIPGQPFKLAETIDRFGDRPHSIGGTLRERGEPTAGGDVNITVNNPVTSSLDMDLQRAILTASTARLVEGR